jgi:hypothetical protein
MFRPAGQLPSEDLKKSECLRSVRIVETLSVKVGRKSTVACTVLHESSFITSRPLKLILPARFDLADNVLQLDGAEVAASFKYRWRSDKIVFNMSERTGSIWTMKLEGQK